MRHQLRLGWVVLFALGVGPFAAGTAAAQVQPSSPPSGGSAEPAPPPGTPPTAGPSSPAPAASDPSVGLDAPTPGTTPPGPLPSPGAPAYGGAPQPGYILEPPPPPPPRRRPELSWSLRLNVLDLVFGKLSGEIEYVAAGPVSVVIGPEYIFGDVRQDSSLGITAKGVGLYGEVGYWIEGRPLRGYFLKAHVAHRSVIFRSEVDRLVVPETSLGAMFGSQSVYGGWFSLSGGFGVAYDLAAEDREIAFNGPLVRGEYPRATLSAGGPLGNGLVLITQLAIGGSF
jgi:hypothetical protein